MDYEYRKMPEEHSPDMTVQIPDRSERQNQQGGQNGGNQGGGRSGSQGSGAGGGSRGGQGGQGGGGNQGGQNNLADRGSYPDPGGTGMQGGEGQNPSRNSRGRFVSDNYTERMGSQEPPKEGKEAQNEKDQSMSHCPTPIIAAAAPVSPFGYPGFGYPGYPGFAGMPASAPQTTVVTGTGDGHDRDALLGITVDNIRESASVGRSTQLAQQIGDIGDRADARAAAERDLFLAREFTTVQKGQADLESRILTAVKDESLRTVALLNEQRVRELENRLANVQEARREDRSVAILQKILEKLP